MILIAADAHGASQEACHPPFAHRRPGMQPFFLLVAPIDGLFSA
jgi:hypothetical protein